MKRLLFGFIFFSLALQSQTDSVQATSAYMQRYSREGKGKSTFTLTIGSLERLIKSCTTATLESKMGVWGTYGGSDNGNYVDMLFNEETKQHDIPEFHLKYLTEIKNKKYKFWVVIPKSLSGNITSIETGTKMTKAEEAAFKQSLLKAGYSLNERLTGLFHKDVWQHKIKPYNIYMVSEDGECKITICEN